MATCDLATLLSDGKCFCAATTNKKDIAELQLLCNILNAISGGGGGPCPQDMQIAWTPTNLKLGELIGLSAFQNATAIPGITNLTISWATNPEGFDIESPPDLVSISAPNLVSITGAGYIYLSAGPVLTSASFPVLTASPGLSILNNAALTSVNLSQFQHSTGSGSNLDLHGNTSLTSLDLHNLIDVVGNVTCSGCTLLSSLNVAAFVPLNGSDFDASACALLAASVNQVLARHIANAGYVSGNIVLDGGTNAAPTGQGIVDKAALIVRGVSVTTN